MKRGLIILFFVILFIDFASASCQSDPWLTLGHDERRTFASGGCITGALQEVFTYIVPPAPVNRALYTNYSGSLYAPRLSAQSDTIFMSYPMRVISSGNTYVVVNKVSASGVSQWQAEIGRDTYRGYTPAVMSEAVYIADDWWGRINSSGGIRSKTLDWWGQIIPDLTRNQLYVVNTYDWHGGRIFIAAMPPNGSYDFNYNYQWDPVWINKYPWNPPPGNSVWSGAKDYLNGAMALDQDTLYWARKFIRTVDETWPWHSGILAFDPNNGNQKWFVDADITNWGTMSPISVGDNFLYTAENNALVARNKTNGSIVWSVVLSRTPVQGPMLTPGLVIIVNSDGVFAFNALSGASAWNSPLSIPIHVLIPYTSVAAAALGSNTLVVTGSNEIYVLSLTDGSQIWSGRPPSLVGAPANPVIVGNRVYITDSANFDRFIALEGSSDTTPPIVSVSSPIVGQTFTGNISLNASASDNVGISRVQFYFDSNLIGEDATSPYSFVWNSKSTNPGAHTLHARAIDTSGNSANSQTLNINTKYCGDWDNNSVYDVLDVTALVEYVFKNGPAPNPLAIGDTNSDGIISDSLDVTTLVDYVFRNTNNLASCNAVTGISGASQGVKTITKPITTKTTSRTTLKRVSTSRRGISAKVIEDIYGAGSLGKLYLFVVFAVIILLIIFLIKEMNKKKKRKIS